jgi:hypothetical protein
MAISVEHDVPLMAPNVLNDGDSGVFGCAEAPFGDVALPHTRCTRVTRRELYQLVIYLIRYADDTEQKIEIILHEMEKKLD